MTHALFSILFFNLTKQALKSLRSVVCRCRIAVILFEMLHSLPHAVQNSSKCHVGEEDNAIMMNSRLQGRVVQETMQPKRLLLAATVNLQVTSEPDGVLTIGRNPPRFTADSTHPIKRNQNLAGAKWYIQCLRKRRRERDRFPRSLRDLLGHWSGYLEGIGEHAT